MSKRNNSLIDNDKYAKGFVVLHIGAGHHDKTIIPHLKRVCKSACDIGLSTLNELSLNLNDEGIPLTDEEIMDNLILTAVAVCSVLESDSNINAGPGSELNYNGQVEVDASIMDSRFKVCASVAAVPLVAKPGYIVSEMWRQVTRGAKDIFGRAKPLLLVGSGALQWGKTNINTRLAKAVGVFVESNQNLVNTHTVRKWKYWRNVVDSRFRTGPENSQVLAIPPENIDDGVKDTVGVVVGDGAGNQVVLTSSGGITLKTSGRVGPAALLGSGISIEVLNLPFGKRSKTECDDSVATHDGLISRTLGTCTTGFGEDIITLQYASRCSRQLLERDEDEMAMDVLEDVYRSCAKNKDDKSPYYLQSDPLYLGVIAVDSSQYDDGLVRNTVVYGHSTETMILASQHASDERCRVTVSCNSTVGNWKSGEFTIG